MKDLNINIGGPTDQARQSVSFQIRNDHREQPFQPERVAALVRELREALTAAPLPDEDRRRLERHLATIDEETGSAEPSMIELRHDVGFVAGLVRSAASAGDTLLTLVQGLAACVGLSGRI